MNLQHSEAAAEEQVGGGGWGTAQAGGGVNSGMRDQSSRAEPGEGNKAMQREEKGQSKWTLPFSCLLVQLEAFRQDVTQERDMEAVRSLNCGRSGPQTTGAGWPSSRTPALPL